LGRSEEGSKEKLARGLSLSDSHQTVLPYKDSETANVGAEIVAFFRCKVCLLWQSKRKRR
jgi:hypothetical protein